MKAKTNNQTLELILDPAVAVKRVGSKIILTSHTQTKPRRINTRGTYAQNRFQEAAQYARQQMNSEEGHQMYRDGITRKKNSAYLVAMTDFLTPPTVHSIDDSRYSGREGDVITVKATDDFQVIMVIVRITDGNGILVEEGLAYPQDEFSNRWVFTSGAVNSQLKGTTIHATAYDHPGNKGELQITL